jgi:hypothetical protein
LGALPIASNGQPSVAGPGGSPTAPVPPGGTTSVDPDFTTVNLSIDSVVDILADPNKPASISGTYYESGKLDDVALMGTAVGDFSVLTGKTLYVIVEDPAGLFAPGAQAIPVSSPKPGLLVRLLGAQLKTPGTFSGNLKVYVCLDARCSTRLGNVPYSIPYNVVVKRGMRLEIEKAFEGTPEAADKWAVSVRSKFGEPPPVANIKVTLPEGRPFSSLGVYTGDPLGFHPDAKVTDNGDGTAVVSLSVGEFVRRPGRYSSHMVISSVVPLSNDQSSKQVLSEYVTFAYAVDVDSSGPDPVVFLPPRLELSNSASTADIRMGYVKYGGATDLAFAEQIEWLLTPEQQAAFPQVGYPFIEPKGYLYAYADTQQLAYRSCIDVAPSGGGVQRFCLPTGTYEFRVGYHYRRPDGNVVTGYYPGSLTVTP